MTEQLHLPKANQKKEKRSPRFFFCVDGKAQLRVIYKLDRKSYERIEFGLQKNIEADWLCRA